MYDLGYLQRLDQEALAPAFTHLSPIAVAGLETPPTELLDPLAGRDDRTDRQQDRAPDIHSINDLFDPTYKGKVEMVTELPRGRAAGDDGRGDRPAGASKQDWLDAIDKIKAAADDGQIRRFTGGDYARDLATATRSP